MVDMPLSTTSSDGLPLAATGRTAQSVALEAAQYAGKIHLRHFRGDHLGTREKRHADIVTDVDVAIEQQLRKLFMREFPSAGFLGEETGEAKGDSDYTWTVDPIDGTANFVRGIPHFATTIALLKNGAPVLGITYDAIRDDTFYAAAGRGLTLNGVPMKPDYATSIEDANLGFDIGPEEDLNVRAFDIVRSLLPMFRVRLMGSGALGFAYAAAGLIDVYFHLALKPWDVSAGLLFIQETAADAVAVDFDGAPATPWSGNYLVGARGLLERVRTA